MNFEVGMRADAGSANIYGRISEVLDLATFFAHKMVVRLAVNFKESDI
jgi:hypothetical protein